MPFFEEGSERLPSTPIGIVRCKTWDSFAVTPNFRRPRASRGSMPVAIEPAFDDQALCPEQTRDRFLVLAGNLVREEDRPSQKTKNGRVQHAKQDSDRPGVAAAPAASLEQASPTVNRIAPLARNFRCHPDAGAAVRGQINVRGTVAALESGVHAAADAARRAA
jgi:hypothetical protein